MGFAGLTNRLARLIPLCVLKDMAHGLQLFTTKESIYVRARKN